MKNYIFTAAALAASFSAFAITPGQDLNELEKRLTKLYDSSEQSLYQPDYFDVTLKHCKINMTDVPASKQNNRYLLVEQSISLYQNRPYRIRLIELGTGRYGQLTSTNYQSQDIDALKGACEEEKTFSYTNLPEAKCTVLLKKKGNDFVGGTPEGGCVSKHNGAEYFTSEVVIGENFIDSWDRGFSKDGTQVWGASKGPYIFKETTAADQAPLVVEMSSNLIGHSTNEEQVAADPSFSKIDYKICPTKIEGLEDKKTISSLVEQVISFPGGEMIRARIYSLTKGPGQDIIFRSYTVKNHESFKGYCETDKPVKSAIPQDAVEWDEQCYMNFQPQTAFEKKAGFFGMTQPGGCESEFRGSKYLTISATLDNESYNIWERWWNADNKLVAGSATGPYIYKRKSSFWYDL